MKKNKKKKIVLFLKNMIIINKINNIIKYHKKIMKKEI